MLLERRLTKGTAMQHELFRTIDPSLGFPLVIQCSIHRAFIEIDYTPYAYEFEFHCSALEQKLAAQQFQKTVSRAVMLKRARKQIREDALEQNSLPAAAALKKRQIGIHDCVRRGIKFAFRFNNDKPQLTKLLFELVCSDLEEVQFETPAQLDSHVNWVLGWRLEELALAIKPIAEAGVRDFRRLHEPS
jgi:hypothetical protein